MKNNWSLIAAAAVIIGVLLYLSSTGKKPPFIPGDGVHGGLTSQDACIACHAEGKKNPLKETHPPKEQCLVCHKVKKA